MNKIVCSWDPESVKLGDVIGEGDWGLIKEVVCRDKRLAVKILDKKKVNVTHMWKEVYIHDYISKDKKCSKYIACYVDIKEDKDYYYILLDLLNGKSLADVYDDLTSHIHKPKSINQILNIINQIFIHTLQCIKWLHRKNVTHNDLHTGNIFITVPNNYNYQINKKNLRVIDVTKLDIKIIDFGQSCENTKYKCTSAGFNYLKEYPFLPVLEDGNIEQWKAYDLYRIGLLIYELLTGMNIENILNMYIINPDKMINRYDRLKNKDEWNWIYPFNYETYNNLTKKNADQVRLFWYDNWDKISKVHTNTLLNEFYMKYKSHHRKIMYNLIYNAMLLMNPVWEDRNCQKIINNLKNKK